MYLLGLITFYSIMFALSFGVIFAIRHASYKAYVKNRRR
jgi:hypothetical protein